MALLVEMQNNSGHGYGKRPDGTEKGLGYFGEIKRPDGNISTELSIGLEIGGKEIEVPTLIPTLTRNEINHLISGGAPTPEIIRKAGDFAVQRIKQGKSPFAQYGEQIQLPQEDK